MSDITERKKTERRLRAAEERLRSLSEANIIGIFSGDLEHILEGNDAFLGMVGYSRDDLVQRRVSWREITPPEYRAVDDRAVRELLDTGACTPFEKEYLRKDGSRVPVLVGATALETSPLRWFGFVMELTERKAMERKLLDQYKLENVGLLAGGIAHDFNNLLVGVPGNASLAEEMLPREHSVSELLREIVKAGEHAAHLTRQMLAYAGKGKFVLKRLDLVEICRDVAGLVKSSISKKTDIAMNIDSDLPPMEGDDGQMQQVFMNLLMNAAEAIGDQQGQICVTIGVHLVSEEYIRRELGGSDIAPGKCVSVRVRDTGCGLDDDTRSRIFDPFFTTKFLGRGLGLAAVAGIVRGHKGAVHVTSAPGKGSEFLVLFPTAKSSIAPLAELPVQKIAEGAGSGTTLFVDDEQVTRQTAKRGLERRGYRVLLAQNGRRRLISSSGNRPRFR